jgi:hypothetical protein
LEAKLLIVLLEKPKLKNLKPFDGKSMKFIYFSNLSLTQKEYRNSERACTVKLIAHLTLLEHLIGPLDNRNLGVLPK